MGYNCGIRHQPNFLHPGDTEGRLRMVAWFGGSINCLRVGPKIMWSGWKQSWMGAWVWIAGMPRQWEFLWHCQGWKQSLEWEDATCVPYGRKQLLTISFTSILDAWETDMPNMTKRWIGAFGHVLGACNATMGNDGSSMGMELWTEGHVTKRLQRVSRGFKSRQKDLEKAKLKRCHRVCFPKELW